MKQDLIVNSFTSSIKYVDKVLTQNAKKSKIVATKVFPEYKDVAVFTKRIAKEIPKPDLYYFKTNEGFYLDCGKEVKPYYYISKLWSMGKGSGTRGIHEVVTQSLKDKETAGRVFLDAACMDGKTSPAGFYYKLGFRFKDDNKNIIMQDWMRHGGIKKHAPMETGLMYLPKENIEHCLAYGRNPEEKSIVLANTRKAQKQPILQEG